MTSELTPEARLHLEQLFERAADLPPTERAGFVDRECTSDGRLRDELVLLLEGLTGEDILMQVQAAPPSRVGTRIGPYELLELIGEGGMGEVYAAEQREPIARRVALKIIKPGMHSAPLIARFAAERQALARMAHANVAQVYDAGATEDGRPYFVMELVDGVPLTEYCDHAQLPTRDRVELFLGICAGAQHAHQKGIIHRDLKPSNLLVSLPDGKRVPKIIDFGIARATTGRLGENTLETLAGHVVGTLDYMSPEQADPTSTDIDTRSDIYSLGVVLYQLISGLLPFEHDSSCGLPLSEIQRRICEQDPPTPSSRLRRKTETATSIAPLHGTEGPTLVRRLTGDLDWICMKALEKDPTRRYASASELAEDLRRHLANEPVLAGPPGTLYRASKFVRRNRTVVTAGALVLVAASMGVWGVVAGRIEAEAEALEAQVQRGLAAESAELARAEKAKVLRLSDIALVQQVEAEAGALWPAHPDRLPALADWLERANELSSRLDRHREVLDEMRARGEHTPEGDWLFTETSDQWHHDLLVVLIERLAGLAVLSESGSTTVEHGWSIPRRISEAERLQAAFEPDGVHAGAWEAALPLIRAAYPSLDLGAQAGLLPLGPDPASGLWEFAHLLSGDPARRVDGRLERGDTTGVVLVLIPGGDGFVGAQDRDPAQPNFDPDRLKNRSRSAYPVALDPFFISKYELTQGQWARYAGGDLNEPPQALEVPVTNVSYIECERATHRLGLTLPDEEQWEYAARAGTTTIWWPGDDLSALAPRESAPLGAGNFLDSEAVHHLPKALMYGEPADWSDGNAGAARIGSYPANPCGLFDVLGNVSEWCSPISSKSSKAEFAPRRELRFCRGGNWQSGPNSARSAFRAFFNAPAFSHSASGLRPARAVDPAP